MALHCSGVPAETASVLASVPPVTALGRDRLERAAAAAAAARAVPLDRDALLAERDGLLA